MPEYRVPTTTKVTAMIQAHADLLEQHGISAGVHASRPTAGTEGRYYLSTDSGIWARDNGTSWDEVSGLSEAYIQGLIDTSISTHAGVSDAHHTKTVASELNLADMAEKAHSSLTGVGADDHHTAPTYDGVNDEVVFQI